MNMGHKKGSMTHMFESHLGCKMAIFGPPIVELQQCTSIFQNITDNF